MAKTGNEAENLPVNSTADPSGMTDQALPANVTNDESKTTSINVNLGAKFTILKTNLVAALQKSEKKWQVLVAPTDAAANAGMSVKEIVEEIQKLMGGDPKEVDGLETQLLGAVESVSQPSGAFDPMSIRFYLRQVFVYYEKGEETSSTEYAFSIEVDTSDMLKNIGVFNLDSIVLSVWNTKRRKVKEKMSMFDIDAYLAELM